MCCDGWALFCICMPTRVDERLVGHVWIRICTNNDSTLVANSKYTPTSPKHATQTVLASSEKYLILLHSSMVYCYVWIIVFCSCFRRVRGQDDQVSSIYSISFYLECLSCCCCWRHRTRLISSHIHRAPRTKLGCEMVPRSSPLATRLNWYKFNCRRKDSYLD